MAFNKEIETDNYWRSIVWTSILNKNKEFHHWKKIWNDSSKKSRNIFNKTNLSSYEKFVYEVVNKHKSSLFAL